MGKQLASCKWSLQTDIQDPQESDPLQLVEAAAALATILPSIGVDYAVAGGMACVLMGSERLTHDLDLVVDMDGSDIVKAKQQVAAVDSRFTSTGNSLYFCGLPIEFLTTRSFVWPIPLKSGSRIVQHDNIEINVLSPAALLLTKCTRMASSVGSTRPKTLSKLRSDTEDVTFIVPQVTRKELDFLLSQHPPDKQVRLRSNLAKVAEEVVGVRQLL